MSKLLVTHKHPDLDAIMSVWLLSRFDQSRYGDAELAFVDAGKTYKNMDPDSDSDITHVDTGLGKFDHHQPGAYGTCASRLIWEHLIAEGLVSPTDTALSQMVDYANEIDTFADCYYPEARESRFAFSLSELIPGLTQLQLHDDEAILRMMMVALDGVYQRLKDVNKAVEAIHEGKEFVCKWGKGVAVTTSADDTSKQAQKMGYDLVVIRDPKSRYMSVKTSPKVEYPLEPIYVTITRREDPKKWYYHNSGHILFNGSKAGGKVETSEITLDELIEIIKSC